MTPLTISIRRLGPVTDTKIVLDNSLAIVYGPPATGKSILLGYIAGITYGLFGLETVFYEVREFYRVEDVDITVDNKYLVTSRLSSEMIGVDNKLLTLYLPSTRIVLYSLLEQLYEALIPETFIEALKGREIVEAIKTLHSRLVERMSKELIVETRVKPEETIAYKLAYSLIPLPTIMIINSLYYTSAVTLLALNREFYENIRRIFNSFETGELVVKDNRLVYRHKTGYESEIQTTSDGVKEVIVDIMLLELLKRIRGDYRLVILIDEVEAHLYPKTLIKLLDYLYSIVKENERVSILVSTHSLYTIAWAIGRILDREKVRLYTLEEQPSRYYRVVEPDISDYIKGFEDLYRDLLLSHIEKGKEI